MERTAVFTICAKNYLHYAQTLYSSVTAQHPEWDFHLCLVDDFQGIETLDWDFSVFRAEELPIPNKPQFFFKYGMLELCTAVKPWGFLHLLEKQYTRVVYLDPDIFVYSKMEELENCLEAGAGIVFTPHLTGPLDSKFYPREIDILKSGTWNLGFCAIQECTEVRVFLDWWKEKLENECIEFANAGYFVDQKWCDLVPGRFSSFVPLRHEGYNVAYWNLNHRHISIENSEYLVNGQPLRFFHFSGLSPDNPLYVSKHQNRYSLSDLPTVEQLVVSYVRTLFKNGLEQFRNLACQYDSFTNGELISREMRSIFLHSILDQTPLHSLIEDPFDCLEYFATTSIGNHPALTYSYLMHAVWMSRGDLQKAYPNPCSSDQIAFTEWLVVYGAHEQVLPQRFIEHSRQELEQLRNHMRVYNQRHKRVQRMFLKAISTLCNRKITKPKKKTTVASDNVHEAPQRRAFADIGEKQFGVLLHGYVRSELGLGQSIRNCIESLRAADVPFAVSDLSEQALSRRSDFSAMFDGSVPANFGINLLHVNAARTNETLRALNPARLKNSYNIGFWHWELPELPENMAREFEHLDEVWTCSEFVANSIKKRTSLPIRILPHAIPLPPGIVPDRNRFGLPTDSYLFLVMYDMMSYQERKNPMAAIQAFRALHRQQEENVGLIIKVMNPTFDFISLLELEAAVADVSNIYLLTETLDRKSTYALLASADCFVSPHRAEGFGFCLAESMALGKPVIATAWSGNLAYMNEANSCLLDYKLVPIQNPTGPYEVGQLWAEPDTEHLTALMKRLVDNKALSKEIGERARTYMKTQHSVQAIGELYESELRRVHEHLNMQL